MHTWYDQTCHLGQNTNSYSNTSPQSFHASAASDSPAGASAASAPFAPTWFFSRVPSLKVLRSFSFMNFLRRLDWSPWLSSILTQQCLVSISSITPTVAYNPFLPRILTCCPTANALPTTSGAVAKQAAASGADSVAAVALALASVISFASAAVAAVALALASILSFASAATAADFCFSASIADFHP